MNNQPWLADKAAAPAVVRAPEIASAFDELLRATLKLGEEIEHMEQQLQSVLSQSNTPSPQEGVKEGTRYSAPLAVDLSDRAQTIENFARKLAILRERIAI